MSPTHLDVAIEHFALAKPFAISRGSKTTATVVRVTLTKDGLAGHGECVPYARYGETAEKTLATIMRLRDTIANGVTRHDLQTLLPASAARNALDCAFWDLEAKQQGTSVANLLKTSLPDKVRTAQTISLDTPDAMASMAQKHSPNALLKIKLDVADNAKRLSAIRKAAPTATLITDANEAWQADDLQSLFAICEAQKITLIEQPLPADNDAPLAAINHPVPICADESAHDSSGLSALVGRYDAINIKLDKTGGLTEALQLAKAAKKAGLGIMVGCMVSTSLSMAPALMLAPYADWIDLDGPLWLKKDRAGGLVFNEGIIEPARIQLWGQAGTRS